MHISGRFETRTEHLLQKLRQVSVPRGTFLQPPLSVLRNAEVVGYGHRVTATRRGSSALFRPPHDGCRARDENNRLRTYVLQWQHTGTGALHRAL